MNAFPFQCYNKLSNPNKNLIKKTPNYLMQKTTVFYGQNWDSLIGPTGAFQTEQGK